MFTHSEAAKNYDLEAQFDRFARTKDFMAMTMRGVNEPEEYKIPEKLPSIILYKSTGEEVDLDRLKLMGSVDSHHKKIN